ncbi:homoserine kinase [Zooshikella sp. RANM57]|uniref:homoserine kinase n=1 Tax=Zooshikella sp. RANM57 TaxID=3425863 RepID=UPI003D6FE111
MSVYTHLSQAEVEHFISKYSLGELVHYEGIAAGVENTNYFVDLKSNENITRYVLTIFEYLPHNVMPFFVSLTDLLADKNLPIPKSLRDASDQALHDLHGKPSLLQVCLAGKHSPIPTNEQCHAIGEMLGKIHQAVAGSSLKQENQRGMAWIVTQVERLTPLVSSNDAELLNKQLKRFQQFFDTVNIPQGIIHGDLFHDNALFTGDCITGIIDFYNACYDYWLYDIAVTVNDWCRQDSLVLDEVRTSTLLKAYHDVRPFTDEERLAWPVILQFAAFRFWVSRLITFAHPEEDSSHGMADNPVVNSKNPDEMRDLMLSHYDNAHLLVLPN